MGQDVPFRMGYVEPWINLPHITLTSQNERKKGGTPDRDTSVSNEIARVNSSSSQPKKKFQILARNHSNDPERHLSLGVQSSTITQL